MLEASLNQLEQLVSDLVQQNQQLQDTNAQLTAELVQVRDDNDSLLFFLLQQVQLQAVVVIPDLYQLTAELVQVRDDNDSLQLNLLEQEEKQGATAARIQALVERATRVSAVDA